MKRLVLFIDSLDAGGAQRQLVGLARLLKQNGYTVDVVVYHDIPFYQHELSLSGIEVFVAKENDSRIGRIISLIKLFRQRSPDVIISYLEAPSKIACILKLFGIRYRLIVSERNTSQNNNWKECLRFNMFRLADYVVPNSFSQQSFIENNYHFLIPKLRTITNYVDLKYFHKTNRLPGSIVKIIIVASVWPPKNTLNFIRAVSIAANNSPNFYVNWYGFPLARTEYSEKCSELISNLDVGRFIELNHKVSDIRDKYYESDFLCLPSYYEGTPNVICEAISCGLPVICSNVCDNGLYVRDNENGFLFDPKNPNEIAHCLERAVGLDSESYKFFSERSRAIAEELLSETHFVNKYIDLIERS